MFKNFFELNKENAHIILKIFGIKITLKSPFINPVEDCCSIPDLKELKKKNVNFPHPFGIVINKNAKIGKNVTIYQNVTIGRSKFKNEKTCTPMIDDNVTIFANAVLLGDIKIGKNVIIGAGSVVLNDVGENCIAAGNPAKVIKKI